MEQEQRGMAALLSKFRIDFSDVSVIADIGRKPNKELYGYSQRFLKKIVQGCWVGKGYRSLGGPWWRLPHRNDFSQRAGCSKGKDLPSAEDSRASQAALHELRSDCLVMRLLWSTVISYSRTLPVPRKGMISASLYMSWLDVMTAGMPPILFVRGNQSSVLTFYS